ncbi:hypothetical protein [Ancylobacter pratisalsi]|uniref:Uncharacterized protein n=1 Tax=Ancylobacter pratisalsi TaxID=1745854 RepID=A0A6P1YKD6_9HYPH|nr:hypothetical protein [Ancylobacter pratisalsi]QIB32254.1 hypothetical protein G3A50_05855 [Ancylobacter pratisalsi]
MAVSSPSSHSHPPHNGPSPARGQDNGHSHSHSHSHGPGRRHPPARPPLSLLRLSAWQRLVIVVPLAALLWAAALWVMHGAGG